MANLWESANDTLVTTLQGNVGSCVNYVRGTQEVELTAVKGRVDREALDLEAVRFGRETQQWIIKASDLDFGTGPTLPQRGDVIEETVGGVTYQFEVVTPDNQTAYRADNARVMLRIFTTEKTTH